MDDPVPLDVIEFVVRSEHRVELLEELSANGPIPKRELRDRVDVVRTTLQRNLDGLAEQTLVRTSDAGYDTTVVGRSVAEGLTELRSVTERAMKVGAVTRHLPQSALEIDLAALEDPAVAEATTANPYLPVERHRERLARADRSRVLIPATAARSLETAKAALENGSRHDVVVSADVARALRTEFADLFERMIAHEDCSYYRYDGDVEFYLGVLDDVVQIGVHDDAGIPQALLECEATPVRTWAIERFEMYRRKSTPIT